MNNFVVYKKLDKGGRLHIPLDIREKHSITPLTVLPVCIDGNKIIIPLDGKNVGSYSINRNIDDVGRINIPSSLKSILNIGREILEIEFNDSRIIISINNKCALCSSTEHLTPFGGKYICSHCIDLLKRKIGA